MNTEISTGSCQRFYWAISHSACIQLSIGKFSTFFFFFLFIRKRKFFSTFKTSIKAFTFNPTLLRVCLVGWNLRRMKKKRMENRREIEWEECLVEMGRGREKWWGPVVFSLGPPQFNLSKMERKWGRKGGRVSWTKLPFSIQWPTFFFFFFFCLDKISSSLHSMYTLVWFGFGFFFFWIKFCAVDVGSFCLFLSFCFFFLISF